eukprot:CAMPEP_0181172052 /NCGR_PEP_ID=MMETSP1096-20121128/2246_1 /TAXON_ID=156174 ORGANISM="Chrysochromulina ericina, Strain CCMP281" /NCGR_SAMPLE_ID=MMETSP1096 /ASSEMBLY_ACC=CAM_ASM_000453 /LENGTH=31 /DNA_ID= /DNA_START= /DNA_END= /DNA_ORIENTATION=
MAIGTKMQVVTKQPSLWTSLWTLQVPLWTLM